MLLVVKRIAMFSLNVLREFKASAQCMLGYYQSDLIEGVLLREIEIETEIL
jgi:hypothetical protein